MIKSDYSIMTGMNYYSDVLCEPKDKFILPTEDRKVKPPRKKRR
tara:strand:+ start:31560 stop:31691 length:132 start_codon:yes stop_codon:yes gene_type:complete